MDYRESHKHPAKGESYHRVFETSAWLRYTWQRERRALIDALRVRHRGALLDFACGTGRVLGFLGSMFTDAVGVDVSESMLQVARRTCPFRTINADLTATRIFAARSFDIITAFRFFPNAEPALRSMVLTSLVDLLANDGALIFNNHQNSNSTLVRANRILRRTIPWTPMSSEEVRKMVLGAGLKIAETYRIGVLPATERRMLCPSFAHDVVDAVAERVALTRDWFQDVIYVCVRS